MSSRHAGRRPVACGPALERSPMYAIKRYIYRSRTLRANLTGRPYRWYPTRTCRTRYVEYSKSHDGSREIFELARDYAIVHKKTRLRILDVGCLNGEAAAYLAERLSEAGLEVGVSGVDPAPEVFDEARRNLDRFYEGCIEEAEIDETFDIVLCARLLRFTSPRLQKGLITLCARHCAPGGILIVDAVPMTSGDAYQVVAGDLAGQYGETLIRAWKSLPIWSRMWHLFGQCIGMMGMTAIYKAKHAARNSNRRSARA